MGTYLRITDSLGSLNLNDNVNYRLQRNQWTPSVAGLVDDLFQPNGPYGTVEEEINIDVLGGASSLSTTIMSNVEAIADKIMAAERWLNGENTLNGAVYLEYAPAGSSADGGTAYRALILGRTEGDKPGAPIGLPNEFNDINNVGTLMGVRVRLVRQGWWLGAEETATSSTTANPAVLTATFSSNNSQQFSALRVAFSGLHDTVANIGTYGGNAVPCGVIAITNATKHIQIYEAEAGGGSTVADVAGKARGGNIARFTAASNVENLLATWSIASGDQLIGRCGQIAVIGMVRNNSVGTTAWQLRFVCGAGPYDMFEADPVTIEAGQTWPRAHVLGVMETDGQDITQFRMYGQAPGTTDTLDIDYVALVGLPNDNGRVIVLADDTNLQNIGFGSSFSSHRFKVDHKIFVQRRPFVGMEASGGGQAGTSYRGDPVLLTGGDNTATGKVVAAALFLNDSNHWVACNPSNTILTNQLTAVRRQAFIIPQ